MKIPGVSAGWLRGIFCRHLGHHLSCGCQLGTSSFLAFVEDLGRTAVGLVGKGREILIHSFRHPKMDD